MKEKLYSYQNFLNFFFTEISNYFFDSTYQKKGKKVTASEVGAMSLKDEVTSQFSTSL